LTAESKRQGGIEEKEDRPRSVMPTDYQGEVLVNYAFTSIFHMLRQRPIFRSRTCCCATAAILTLILSRLTLPSGQIRRRSWTVSSGERTDTFRMTRMV